MKNFRLLKSAIATITLAGSSILSQPITSSATAQAKPQIVASYSVLCDLLDTIAADTIDLTCLIEGGVDPHTYRPTPRQSKAIEEAQVIVYGGYDFEPRVITLVERVAESKPVIALHEAVVTDPIMADGHDHGHEDHDDHDDHDDHKDHDHDDHDHDDHKDHDHDDHDHDDHKDHDDHESAELSPDPHVWHDVNNAIAMVEYLQSMMLQIAPAQAATYLENSNKLTSELVRLHPWIQNQVATIPEGQRVLITTHDALNYYVRAYEFEGYQQLQGLSSEDSPSAEDVRNLVTEIRETQVPTIFAEVTASDRVLKNVAREAGVTISDTRLVADGLGKPGSTTDTYTKMMVSNTCAIVDGLGGQCSEFE